MKTFTESLRSDYPFNHACIVMEIGCHTGNWAKAMAEKFGCRVLTFEPIKRFYDEAHVRFLISPISHLVCVENVGIGATTRRETLRIKGDMSGIVADGEPEEVQMVAIDEALRHEWVKDQPIDLLAINCEGCEYEILDALLEQGLMARFTNIQIQWHSVVPLAEARRDSIRNMLRITHRPTWELGAFDNGWDGWELK